MYKKIGTFIIILSLFSYTLICLCDGETSESSIISPQTAHQESDNHSDSSHDPDHHGRHTHGPGWCECQKIFNVTNKLFNLQPIFSTFSFIKYSSLFPGIYQDQFGKDLTTSHLSHGPPSINSSTTSLYFRNSVLRI